MNASEYAKMAKFEKFYWWHKGRLSLVESLIYGFGKNTQKMEIVEVGCGTGENLRFLSKFGNTHGLDISDDAIKFCKERGLKNIYKGDICDTKKLEKLKLNNKFDLIVALDVLEHIQDDVLALKNIYKLLKQDGFLLVIVPAYKFLWSEHDESLHHKRRYHSPEITGKLKDANFNIIKNTHFITAVFPLIAFYRLLNNFIGKSVYPKTSYITLPKHLNTFMVRLLEIETFLVEYINLPFGTSILVVAKR